MGLPKNLEDFLKENRSLCFEDNFEITQEDIDWFRDNLGVKKEDSAFIYFYSIVAFPPVGSGDQLHTLEEIMKESENKYHEQECPGIYDRFLQISSIEGEGSYFYEPATDRVYDTNWGEEESMMSGTLKKNWPSFYSFLEWYYSLKKENA